MKFVGAMGLFVGATAEREAYTAADVGQAWYSTDDLDVQLWNGTGWDAAIPDDAVTAAKIDPTAAWGASSTELLNFVPYTDSNYLLARAALTNDTDFVATIAGLPGGAVLTYNAPTSGDERCIDPQNANNLAKLVLHNTTRGDSALIDDVNVGTNTITLTANVPGTWQVGDTITARSQTNIVTWGGTYFFDIDVSATFGPTVAVLVVDMQFYDSGAAGEAGYLHPYEAYSSAKNSTLYNSAAAVYIYRTALVPLISQRFTVAWTASGAGTATTAVRITGYFEEAAT